MWVASPSLVWVPLALAAAGLVALASGLRRTGLLSVCGAVAWPGAALVTGAGAAYAAGLVAGPLWPLVAGLLCAHAIGLLGRGVVRWLVVATGAVAAGAGWYRATVYQGFDDPACHRSCDVNPLLVTTRLGLADDLATAATLASAVLWAAVLVALVWTVVDGSARAAAVSNLVGVTAAISLAETCTRLGGATPEVPSRSSVVLHVAAALGIVAVVSGLVWQRVRLVRALNVVRRVLTDRDAVGVAPLLASALRDREVVVGHYVEGAGCLDRSHRSIGTLGPGRRRTELLEDGHPVAVIDHAADIPPELLAGRVGATMRMTIQNEGLQLRLEREVAKLADSRRRIVERGDAERVRLERDLHDGAQQGVLALFLEVERLRARAAELGDTDAQVAAVEAASAAQSLLGRLRDVARGIHPAVLDGGGLQPALRQLADTSPDPFFLSVGDVNGVSPATQRAAYAIARDATLTRLQAMRVWIDGDVFIAVDSPDPAPDVVRERAAASGAALVTTETGWEVRLPCA